MIALALVFQCHFYDCKPTHARSVPCKISFSQDVARFDGLDLQLIARDARTEIKNILEGK